MSENRAQVSQNYNPSTIEKYGDPTVALVDDKQKV